MKRNDGWPIFGGNDVKIYTVPCNAFIAKLWIFQSTPHRVSLKCFYYSFTDSAETQSDSLQNALPQRLMTGKPVPSKRPFRYGP